MRKPKRIYEAVPEEDFIKLIKATKKRIHKVCFILAYGSGLRVSEIKNLQLEDIDLKEHKLFIRQGKGGKDRIVNSPQWLKQAHLKYFPIKISIRAIQMAFLNASKKAGFNSIIYTDEAGRPRYKYHLHSLRHSFATRALAKGVPIHYVQSLLGHSSLATTSRYTKANPIDAIQDIIEKGV